MPGQIIQCFVGQYGVQVGNAALELLCVEHGLGPDGKRIPGSAGLYGSSFDSLFAESGAEQYSPRCALIDTEPTVIDEVRVGCYRNLFYPKQLISSYEDAASNFARGYYRIGRRIMKPTLELMRHLVEACDNLQGFALHHSCGGGTGSGFTTALLEQLYDEYTKRSRIEIALFPSVSLNSATVEPYNSLLSCSLPIEASDFTILTDNKSLLTNCTDRLEITRPTMTHLNRLLAQVVSGLITPMQAESQLQLDVSSLQTNLVPYPRAHFVVGSLAPLNGTNMSEPTAMSCAGLTQEVFEPAYQLLTCPMEDGPVYLACCLLYRGAVRVNGVTEAIQKLKASGQLNWVDWCPTGFKVAISPMPMTSIPGSYIRQTPYFLMLLHNSTLLVPSLTRVLREFQALFSRRAFIHWYTSEGMDEAQFSETFAKLSELLDEYAQFQQPIAQTETKMSIHRPSGESRISIQRPSSITDRRKSLQPSTYLSESRSSLQQSTHLSDPRASVTSNELSRKSRQFSEVHSTSFHNAELYRGSHSHVTPYSGQSLQVWTSESLPTTTQCNETRSLYSVDPSILKQVGWRGQGGDSTDRTENACLSSVPLSWAMESLSRHSTKLRSSHLPTSKISLETYGSPFRLPLSDPPIHYKEIFASTNNYGSNKASGCISYVETGD